MNMKHALPIVALSALTIPVSATYGFQVTDQDGGFKSKSYGGKLYNDRGKYTGMITPEGKMYDEKGNFTGQIKNQSILDRDGSAKGFIRDGKIYDQDGTYKGLLKP